MPKIIYDLESWSIKDQEPGGVYGFISFKRLREALSKAGELGDGELITHFVIDESGLRYRVTRD